MVASIWEPSRSARGRADERRLRAVGAFIGRGTPLLPERVRYMPIAYRARQTVRAQQRLERALAERPL
jgi:uncharacterized protein (DUF2236 family)